MHSEQLPFAEFLQFNIVEFAIINALRSQACIKCYIWWTSYRCCCIQLFYRVRISTNLIRIIWNLNRKTGRKSYAYRKTSMTRGKVVIWQKASSVAWKTSARNTIFLTCCCDVRILKIIRGILTIYIRHTNKFRNNVKISQN